MSYKEHEGWKPHCTDGHQSTLTLKIHLIVGVDFPIAITYSNQTAKSRNADLKGIAGFAIDFAKLTARR